MGALDKFKNLFSGSASSQTHSKSKGSPAAKKKDSPETKAHGPMEKSKTQEKVEVEILRKNIQQKLKKDPQLAKKAALVIEKMIQQKPKK